jgi:hypothetical protein
MKDPIANKVQESLFKLLNDLLEANDIDLYPEKNKCNQNITNIIASTPKEIHQIADIFLSDTNQFRINILKQPFTYLSWKIVEEGIYFSFNSQPTDPKIFLNFLDTKHKSKEFKLLYQKILVASLYY